MTCSVTRMRVLITCLVLCFVTALPRQTANAQVSVSIELVLAIDTSLSVNDFEYKLQMKGIADALRSSEILELISLHEGVAMTVIQWAGWSSDKDMIVWRKLKSSQSVHSFADEVEAMRRHSVGNLTAIGSAIEASLHEIATNGYAGELLKIDISGDGTSNAGPNPTESRLLADYTGVTINGLAILTDVENLAEYYRRDVATGRGAFVIEAVNYQDFARAIRLKLLRELAPAISLRNAPAPMKFEPGHG